MWQSATVAPVMRTLDSWSSVKMPMCAACHTVKLASATQPERAGEDSIHMPMRTPCASLPAYRRAWSASQSATRTVNPVSTAPDTTLPDSAPGTAAKYTAACERYHGVWSAAFTSGDRRLPTNSESVSVTLVESASTCSELR